MYINSVRVWFRGSQTVVGLGAAARVEGALDMFCGKSLEEIGHR